MKIDPSPWIDADLECINKSIETTQRITLSISKPIAVVFNTVVEQFFENLKLEKLGYNQCFGEDCFQRFLNETLEIGT